jgi:hypothetical protein
MDVLTWPKCQRLVARIIPRLVKRCRRLQPIVVCQVENLTVIISTPYTVDFMVEAVWKVVAVMRIS